MSGEMWLTLHDNVSVAIDRREAFRLTEDEFASLYRRHVLSASRKEAKAWAKEQVAKRVALVSAADTEEGA